MRSLGELCLLLAFVGSGYSAFVGINPHTRRVARLRRSGQLASFAAAAALTCAIGVLAVALLRKDFTYAYVAQYSSTNLPWHYSVSALWVGQAGSLLLWAWMLAWLGIAFRSLHRAESSSLVETAAAVAMGFVSFLSALMVFAADPMAGSTVAKSEGAGLSPLLQHPSMLMHPPIVFLGYSLWTIPFALVVAALTTGAERDRRWLDAARGWALAAWAVLGIGIMLGAHWAYEELGWGGYWAWDPVENGSLIPWLTGTASIHAMMAWRHRGVLKRTAVALTVATFCLCNFATFLTRSGIFSSLHAFSKSPIGWSFLGLMIVLSVVGLWLLARRRRDLRPDRRLRHVLSREAVIALSNASLLLLTGVVVAGTLSSALSSALTGEVVLVGPPFYNRVLIPIGLVLLTSVAVAPLLSWGRGPNREQRRALVFCALVSVVAAAGIVPFGGRHPLFLAVVGLSVLAAASLVAGIALDGSRTSTGSWPTRLLGTLRRRRDQYAGFVIHAGFVCLALGITGSSLGKRERDFALSADQPVRWDGRRIRLVQQRVRRLPDKTVMETEVEIETAGRTARLTPARHLHRLGDVWTTEVAIDSTWRGDLYVIAHQSDRAGRAHVTVVDNPMMRWIWLGGWLAAAGTTIRLWPRRRHRLAEATGVDRSTGRRVDDDAHSRSLDKAA